MGMRFKADGVKQYVAKYYTSCGADAEWARKAAEVIVTSDLFDIQTHGIERMKDYHQAVLDGKLVPSAKPEMIQETPVSALVDGHEGLGHALAVWCMELAIKKAKTSGVGIVSLRNSNHYGFAGYYPLMAIREHLIGFSVTNTEGLMVPTGSKEPLLGSNPIAFGMYAEPYPFLLDMSTTVVPGGKLSLYTRDGKKLMPGCGLDTEGKPTVEPAEVRAGINSKRFGGILPLGGLGEDYGGHKGYGLAMMVEILSSIIAGTNTSNNIRRFDKHDRNGEFFVAMDYSLFGDPVEMEKNLSMYMETLRNSERFDAATPIYTHGQKQFESAKRNAEQGIFVRESTYQEQLEVARAAGFDAVPYFTLVESDS